MEDYNGKMLGERIKKKRKEKKLSQFELEEMSGISHTHISNIENGKKKASVDVLRKIATCLDVSMDYLCTGVVETDDMSADSKILIQRNNSKNIIDQLSENKLELAEKMLNIILESEYL